jgi:hypothetical protein
MEPLVQHRVTQADRTRRAGKAAVTVASAKDLQARRLAIILQASGLLLSALLALLLMRP